MTAIGKGFLALVALMGFLFFSLQAMADTTRSHACHTIEDAQTLANHLIEHEWVGYMELFQSLHDEGKCIGVLIPVPTLGPPIWTAHSDTFDVGLFPLASERGVVYGLLLGRYSRLSAS